MASWSSAAHSRAQVAVGKPDKVMGTCFITREPAGRGDVELKGIKRSRRRSRAQALRMGYALGGPEQLEQLPFGQGLTREFSDRAATRQCFFE